MMRTMTLTLPCPGDDGACPETLLIEANPGSPPIVDGPPDRWFAGDPAVIVSVGGCRHADVLAASWAFEEAPVARLDEADRSAHADALVAAWAFEEAIFAALDEADRRAYDDAMEARVDRARDGDV